MTGKNKLILSTAYLPPVHYFSSIIHHPDFCIEKFENYTKQSYRNRCTIGSANGLLDLVIPVKKTSPGKTIITEVKIDNDYNWQTLHWRAIVSAYKNSPYFEYYEFEFLPYFQNFYENLFDYNFHLITKILSLLEIEAKPDFTGSFVREYTENTNDLRYSFHPKQNKSFPKINFEVIPYSQVFSQKHGFLPSLSIIDLLFNTGPSANQYLLVKKSCTK